MELSVSKVDESEYILKGLKNKNKKNRRVKCLYFRYLVLCIFQYITNQNSFFLEIINLWSLMGDFLLLLK